MPTIAKGGTAIKVACLECIRGHRSSQCNHVNKVLIEVRKPGRPLNPAGASGNGQDGVNATNLQPAYVVSGHSRCECPTTGVIPESDWKQTESQPYPKGKNAEQAFRVAKSSTKSRGSRLSVSRRTSHLQEKNLTESLNSHAHKDPSKSPPKSSCCQSKAPKEKIISVSQNDLDRGGYKRHNQQRSINGSAGTTTFSSLKEQHNSPDDFSLEPLKVSYDTQYDNMSDSQFRLFIDSLSPAEMVEIFPWRSNPRPWPSVKQGVQEMYTAAGRQDKSPDGPKDILQLNNGSVGATGTDECTCGDDCACLGCAMHPANATTMDHVREATEFMQNDPHYIDGSALMTFEHVTAVLQARRESRMASLAHQDTNQFTSMTPVPASTGVHDPMLKDMGSSEFPIQDGFPMQSPLASGNLRNFQDKIHTPHRYEDQDALLYTGFGPQQQAFAIHPFSGSGQVFVMSQQQRPSCVDDHGFCRCGPDCSCAGCQVHSTSHLEQAYSLNGSPHLSLHDDSASDSIQSHLLAKLQENAALSIASPVQTSMTPGGTLPPLPSTSSLSEDYRNRFGLSTPHDHSGPEDIPTS